MQLHARPAPAVAAAIKTAEPTDRRKDMGGRLCLIADGACGEGEATAYAAGQGRPASGAVMAALGAQLTQVD